MRPGDSLVVWVLDRLGRIMHHLIQIVNELNEQGVSARKYHNGSF
ncbi:unnamed protein product [Bacillus thuringiensis DB27]|uniref:Resolvase/invertase-type recombinase catalytic domain-containing protein n=1 Tax=Bacillus thuringiensis DB27 TaxID=1431339 RepID=W8ZAL5_BACTU|nr:unnamed protein product [Bacillus thuringiensis DB27]